MEWSAAQGESRCVCMRESATGELTCLAAYFEREGGRREREREREREKERERGREGGREGERVVGE